ncbi:HAD-IA family hydrolase [Streptomyces chiangmaiensis]|uniref:HAD-IA family hydrolase n=1 Tax=Streptomyces chiangmaiensis TaxID=766497 RepID=A0ABU7FBD0_9ACTN|nr:HAD-IA family hydrolase [Streptomyces chiangmaiensis]MED7820638.1 HAD-IA family hydrolase [Streptomyces chiangmaiensis]
MLKSPVGHVSGAPLQAVLFDMDGTLVDTELQWWEAVEHVAARPLTEADQPEVLGRPVEHTAAWLATTSGASAADLAERLHREFVDRVRIGIVPRPGALDLLDALARDGVPTALVTASPRTVADTVLKALGAGRFAVSVTADDTDRSKPDPAPYLAACRALGVDPAACVAVEDTQTGVRSAEAAGCAVLAVPSLAPIDAAPGRTVRASLAGVTPEDLRAIAAGDTADRTTGYELRVMSWNLWLGGTRVDDHRAKQLKAIMESGADIVGLQETGGTAAQELADALGWYHHRAGENLGIISRHPLTRHLGDPDVGFYGAAGARIRIAPGREVDIWTAHLDHTPYGPYESVFDGLPADVLIAHEEVRLAQMRDTLRRIEETADDGVPVVLVGDFNCPSHLDRPDVAWPVTRAAEEAGLRDSYREAHPDPAGDPGHTWSPIHPVHEDGSGRREPQDRIDYVLHRGLEVLDSLTYVSGSPRPWPDVFGNEWPSDHAAVITTFAVPPTG